MSALDRYERKVTCQGCGEVATLGISENDYPFMKRLDRKVEYVSDGFTAKMKNEKDIAVHCNRCGQDTEW